MSGKTILILGGGIGGIVTARELRRQLGPPHRIIVIEKNSTHSFPPSYLWVVVGWRKPEAIRRPLAALEKYGIELHHAAVQNIDAANNTVETDRARLPYDYLVVALGTELDPAAVPGLAGTARSFYTLDQAVELNREIAGFDHGSIGIVVSRMPYKCPPAPFEAALLLESYFMRRNPGAVRIELFTPEATPLAVAGPDAGVMIGELLRRRGIFLHTGRSLRSVDSATRTLTFEDGSTAGVDLLVAVPPHRPPLVIRSDGLADGDGWIPVDPRTLRTGYGNIFAIGDITSIRLANGLPMPKAGVFAHNEAEVVAHNIAREISGAGIAKEFTGSGFCFLETGNGKAGYVSGNFLASPSPDVAIHEPSYAYHWAKVTFEKYWLWRWF